MCHEEVTQEVSKYNFFLLQYTNNYIYSQNTGQSDWWLVEATLWAKVFERNQNLSSHPLSLNKERMRTRTSISVRSIHSRVKGKENDTTQGRGWPVGVGRGTENNWIGNAVFAGPSSFFRSDVVGVGQGTESRQLIDISLWETTT